MIVPTTGNLLESDAEALVNTVNCVGVMGKGIALQFKQAFPEMFEAYRRAAKAGEVRLGSMHVHETGAVVGPRFIINFPTKKHWRSRSRLEDIERGLQDLVQQVDARGIASIAIPPLGCGNGGLEWERVRPLIVDAFASRPAVRVLLHQPRPEPQGAERRVAQDKPALTPARAAILQLMSQYQVAGYALTQLEIQKLAYFLQCAGESLQLRFEPHHYGPYAHNLNHVLRRLDGHYIAGAVDVKPGTRVSLLGGAADEAARVIERDEDVQGRLALVARLVEGFETPYSLELLATVHWVVKEHPEAAHDVDRCIELTHAWSERKRSVLRPEHIAIAHRALEEQGWFERV